MSVNPQIPLHVNIFHVQIYSIIMPFISKLLEALPIEERQSRGTATFYHSESFGRASPHAVRCNRDFNLDTDDGG